MGPRSDDGPPTVLIENKMQEKMKKKKKKEKANGWMSAEKEESPSWPFEFKHMSDVVKTCQIAKGEKKTGAGGNEALGHTG